MDPKRVILALLIVALLAPWRANAQQQTLPQEAVMWRTLVARLKPAALVSVRLKDGSHFKGIVLRVDAETFAVKPLTRIPVAARDVRFDELVTLRPEKVSMSPGKKVLLGVGIGAAVYMLTVVLLLAATGLD